MGAPSLFLGAGGRAGQAQGSAAFPGLDPSSSIMLLGSAGKLPYLSEPRMPLHKEQMQVTLEGGLKEIVVPFSPVQWLFCH